jgi:hypothetical protein
MYTSCEEYGCLYEPCEYEEDCDWLVCRDCGNEYEDDED